MSLTPYHINVDDGAADAIYLYTKSEHVELIFAIRTAADHVKETDKYILAVTQVDEHGQWRRENIGFKTLEGANRKLNALLREAPDPSLIRRHEILPEQHGVGSDPQLQGPPTPDNRAQRTKPEKPGPEPIVEKAEPQPAPPSNRERAEATRPGPQTQSPGPEESIQDTENEIKGFFGNGRRATGQIRSGIESYVDEGGSPILAALGATFLDTMDLAMGIAEGIPLGLLDVRRVGEGFAQGDWQGVKTDLNRIVGVLPGGRLIRAADIALTGVQATESLIRGNVVDAALQVGMSGGGGGRGKGRGGGRGGGAGGGGGSGRKPRRRPRIGREQRSILNHLRDNVMAKVDIAQNIARHEPGIRSKPRATGSLALHEYARTSLIKRFGDRMGSQVPEKLLNRRLRKMGKQDADLTIITRDGKEMIVELKAKAFLDKKGRMWWPAGVKGFGNPKTKLDNMKKSAALKHSAKKNPDKLHVLVDPNNIFVFDVKANKWVKVD